MKVIDIYGKDACRFCTEAKSLARTNGYRFFYHDISAPVHKRALKKRIEAVGSKVFDAFMASPTVPQIFVGDHYIGGFAELEANHQKGVIEALGVVRHG